MPAADDKRGSGRASAQPTVPCAGRASWGRESRASRRSRAPSFCSEPLSSPSSVSSVQALRRLPSSACGSTDNAAAAPDVGLELEDGFDRVGAARITLRGAARSGSIAKPEGATRRASGASLAGWRRQPLRVLDIPAQRQHVARVAVAGMEQGLPAGRGQASPAPPANWASQSGGGYPNCASVLSSMRVSRHAAVCAARFLARYPIPIGDRAERAGQEMPPIPRATG